MLAYTTTLWIVPLSLLTGQKVGWHAVVGVLLCLARIVVLVDPRPFGWSDTAITQGHVWLLPAGFTEAIAIGTALVISGLAIVILERSRD